MEQPDRQIEIAGDDPEESMRERLRETHKRLDEALKERDLLRAKLTRARRHVANLTGSMTWQEFLSKRPKIKQWLLDQHKEANQPKEDQT